MLDREEVETKAKSLLKDSYSQKEKIKIPAQDMMTQDPKQRVLNMDEVALGYTDSQAILKANRCLQCKTKPCIEGCPVRIDIPAFIKKIAEKDVEGAYDVISESSLLPSICGRVCPQESQCQKYCTVGKMFKDVDKSVGIGRLERYVADVMREQGNENLPKIEASTGKKVAVVGSGPASISAAADLRKAGHEVFMFEALHKGGGVLVYGIPEFRLPKEIVAKELNKLEKMGVHIETNFLVGRTRKLQELLNVDGFDAIFIGTGAGLPKFLNIPGENNIGVFSANEYLTRSNLMYSYDKVNSKTPQFVSKNVAVFGGGNVAMDSARTALRLGAENVTIVYRRSKEELPARREEVHHAIEEGVKFLFLHSPLEVCADERQRVTGVKLITCELGEPDASGRRRPVEIKGTEKVFEFDTVIVAIGNNSNPLIKLTTPEIETNRRGNFVVNEETMETSITGVYAGGDIVLGAATVIKAMGQGRQAAKSMNEFLKK